MRKIIIAGFLLILGIPSIAMDGYDSSGSEHETDQVRFFTIGLECNIASEEWQELHEMSDNLGADIIFENKLKTKNNKMVMIIKSDRPVQEIRKKYTEFSFVKFVAAYAKL